MSYKRRDFVRHLSRHGCVLKREGSNHSWWENPGKNRRSSVPRHNHIDRHLAKKICRDLGIDPM
ncbi:MAG: addiction module toxin, HicA family [Verrucomicrobia bacterium]|nr:addiction module toxin, HicA family [Verrucomicrobiota bacterium]